MATPAFNQVIVYGGLMIKDDADYNFTAKVIFVTGTFAVGYPDTPHTHKFTLKLRGNHNTPPLPSPYPNVGAKALGKYHDPTKKSLTSKF